MMSRRSWDDRWRRYPPSVPLPAPGGLVTSKQRGAMADAWWSRRFVDVLESYGLGARMQRGRRYARSGQVLSLETRPAVIAAQVQGSRRTPYLITISLPEPSARQWQAIEAAMSSKVGFVARLLDGEVPPDLEAVFDAAGVVLLPTTWPELRTDCSCPDWENPCKHIAAVLYVFADQLEGDPWLLVRWRGRTRDEIVHRLHQRGGASVESDERVAGKVASEIAPWWPFARGPLPEFAPSPGTAADQLIDPDRPAAVLDQLEELDVEVAGSSVRDALAVAYSAFAGRSL